MRFIHSVWTKPMKGDRWGIKDQLKNNLWLFALSIAYIKKQGHEIVLHTDKLGKEIYGQLPYDKVFLTLNKLENSAHEIFWAAGKLLALKAEPIESIHIDGDVFLKKPKVFDLINNSRADLIAQMIEGCICINYSYKDSLDIVTLSLGKKTPVELNVNQNSAINCGLVKFNNPEFKKRYIDGYEKMLKICNNEHFVKRKSKHIHACPDLILEQWWLKSVLEYYNYSLQTILPDMDTERSFDKISNTANEIGYTHVVGSDKYYQIGIVKERLSEVAPELYKKVNKIISKL